MHAGKHQEYEKKLHDALLNKTQTTPANNPPAEHQKPPKNKENAKERENSLAKDRESSIAKDRENSMTKERENSVTPPNKDGWPLLNRETDAKEKDGKKPETNPKKSGKSKSAKTNGNIASNSNNNVRVSASDNGKSKAQNRGCSESSCLSANATNQNKEKSQITASNSQNENGRSKEDVAKDRDDVQQENTVKIHSFLDDNSSFFSQNAFQKIFSDNPENTNGAAGEFPVNSHNLNEPILDIHNTEDWEAAFGFTKHSNHLEELAKMRNNVNGVYEKNGEIAQGVLDVFAAQKNGSTNGFNGKFFDEEKANCFLKYQPGWLQNYEIQQQKRQLEEQLAQLSLKSSYFGGGNRLK